MVIVIVVMVMEVTLNNCDDNNGSTGGIELYVIK